MCKACTVGRRNYYGYSVGAYVLIKSENEWSCTIEIKHFQHVCEVGEFQDEGSPSTTTNHFV